MAKKKEDSLAATDNKPVHVGVVTRSRSRNKSPMTVPGVVTRSRSRNKSPMTVPARKVLEKRKPSRKERVQTEVIEDIVSPPPSARQVIDPSSPPARPIISLTAADCILKTSNNPFYRRHDRVIEEEPRMIRAIDLNPEIRHAMELMNMPTDHDYDWLLKSGLPNEEQQIFLADLSRAIKDVMNQKETADYLEGIFRKRVPSSRHDSFMTKVLELQHDFVLASGAGPFNLNEAHVLVQRMEAILYNIASEAEIKSLGHVNAYILNVWLPEFIVFAVQKVMQVSYKKAEEVFLTASSFL